MLSGSSLFLSTAETYARRRLRTVLSLIGRPNSFLKCCNVAGIPCSTACCPMRSRTYKSHVIWCEHHWLKNKCCSDSAWWPRRGGGYKFSLGPVHTGRGAPCNTRTQIMEHTTANGSVHTGCKKHQRVCTQSYTQICSRVLCERGLRCTPQTVTLVKLFEEYRVLGGAGGRGSSTTTRSWLHKAVHDTQWRTSRSCHLLHNKILFPSVWHSSHQTKTLVSHLRWVVVVFASLALLGFLLHEIVADNFVHNANHVRLVRACHRIRQGKAQLQLDTQILDCAPKGTGIKNTSLAHAHKHNLQISAAAQYVQEESNPYSEPSPPSHCPNCFQSRREPPPLVRRRDTSFMNQPRAQKCQHCDGLLCRLRRKSQYKNSYLHVVHKLCPKSQPCDTGSNLWDTGFLVGHTSCPIQASLDNI